LRLSVLASITPLNSTRTFSSDDLVFSYSAQSFIPLATSGR
jgi:hypothetical protein